MYEDTDTGALWDVQGAVSFYTAHWDRFGKSFCECGQKVFTTGWKQVTGYLEIEENNNNGK